MIDIQYTLASVYSSDSTDLHGFDRHQTSTAIAFEGYRGTATDEDPLHKFDGNPR